MTEGGQVDPGQSKHSTDATKSSNINFTARSDRRPQPYIKTLWRAPPTLKSFADPVSLKTIMPHVGEFRTS